MSIFEKNGLSANITVSEGEFAIAKVGLASTILKANVVADKNLTAEDKEKLGFSINTMLISCYYNNIRCNTTDFKVNLIEINFINLFLIKHTYGLPSKMFRDPEYGNCYTFNDLYDVKRNVLETRKATKPGLKNGLILYKHV